ncbi:DNA-directed RNA polymerase subunit beta' [Flavobacteriales bacterium]|nr:DNA-directed RNA polymerase subunit beta' [Flavobacteriales bacterium]
MRNTKNSKQTKDINSIKISLSSPEDMLERSYGEVVKPETINYRTYKPESGGLFCERVFGPTKDFECHCGKYKRIRYRGIVCDRCGVEVTEKKVRRERVGHISLVVPVAHIWYFKTLPNKIGYLLGLPSKKLDMIIYYERYVVINVGNEPIVNTEGEEVKYLDFLTEEEYLDILDSIPTENQYLADSDPNKFIAKMGAEALHDLLANLNLDELSYNLRNAAANETSQQRKAESLKRLQVVESMRDAQTHSENNPEWMIVKVIPVIPPELRPLVPLDGGRFATSDLNDLYRRVIIRNNRLKRLMEINAPDIILRNEKRMLQESVDALFDNSRKASAVKADGKRALKSLSDSLKGKQGRFRQNLLGKRVDYSARSVIVVGPDLNLHECGLPKDMSAELYKPFIIRKLLERGIVKTVKSAKKIIDNREPVVWDILENVMKGHPVLLNRAPTLHRLGIQAFQPKMIEGKAIQLHPLACAAFNADFDGDQMAVHLPLGSAAILEAQVLMLASHNILNPANGAPITVPSQDMVLGLYYMTKQKRSTKEVPVKGEGKTFYSLEEVKIAFNEGQADLHAIVKVRVKKNVKYQIIETTVGRILFNEYVPEGINFIDQLLTKKALRNVIGDVLNKCGVAKTVHFLDAIKNIGFEMAFKGGLSFNLGDVIVPEEKQPLIDSANKKVDEIKSNYQMGFITNNERYNQVIDVWTTTNARLTDVVMKNISTDKQGFNSVYMMLDSGARGSKEQIRQLSGMRGLMAKPKKSGDHGESIIENPITTNFREGLSILEYFISTHGARKGLADTALKTADAGYLTRRLVDVAQDVIITEEDCGTLRGIEVSALKNNDDIIESLSDRIVGRVSLHDVYKNDSDELIVSSGDLINHDISKQIENEGYESVEIRSALTCATKRGICSKCYGISLATGRMAQVGEAVGVVAAQSVGEPGTQLTLRTFHVGGTASRSEVDSSLIVKKDGTLEIEDLKTVINKNLDGVKNEIVISRTAEAKVVDSQTGFVLSTNIIPYGSIILKKSGKVSKDDVICEWDPYNAVIISDISGKVQFNDIQEGVTSRVESDEQTGHKENVIIDSRNKKLSPSITISLKKDEKTFNIPVGAHVSVSDKDKIEAGTILAKIPRSAGSSGDITGGLPRVTEMFEARNPSNPAVVTEIDGIVSLGKIKRGNREVIITSKNGDVNKYLIKLSKHILVQENDFVKSGSPLCDGIITPSDILAIKGVTTVQEYIVNEIQDVYRLQGVKINDKHFEVLVRQMMRKVQIVDSGDTYFLEKQLVSKTDFMEQNDAIFGKKFIVNPNDSTEFKAGQIVSVRELREENSRIKRKDGSIVEARDAVPSISSPVLQGITRASLQVDSWISAASFQQTTKVLNEAAINAKRDPLIGLKENVIIGKKIPAGTGLVDGNDVVVGSQIEMDHLNSEDISVNEEVLDNVKE